MNQISPTSLMTFFFFYASFLSFSSETGVYLVITLKYQSNKQKRTSQVHLKLNQVIEKNTIIGVVLIFSVILSVIANNDNIGRRIPS